MPRRPRGCCTTRRRRPSSRAASDDPHSPWARADGWRLGHAGKRIVAFVDRGERIEVSAHGAHGNYRIECGELQCTVSDASLRDGWLGARFGDVTRRWRSVLDRARVSVHDSVRRHTYAHAPAFAYTTESAASSDRILAPMPGRVVVVKAAAGDSVDEGQELLVMEAMKMELSLKAPRAGRVETVRAAAGDFVDADAVLVKLEAAP